MGIFSRIGEIINANISTMLDKAEDPEKMVRLMIHEMEDTLTEVKSSAAEVIAERIRLKRELKTLTGYGRIWEQKAELAVSKDRDDLAREAIERGLLYKSKSKATESRLKDVDGLVKQYQGDIARLEEKLQSAVRRQKELNTSRRRAENRLRIQEKIYRLNTSGAFAQFEEFSNKIDRLEAEGEVQRVASDGLERKFQELEQAGEIDQELKKLKKKSRKASKSTKK